MRCLVPCREDHCVRVQAAVVDEPNHIEIRQIEIDEPKADEVLVRLVATGVCHTDLSVLRGNLPLPTPFVPGHEGAGIVEAVGPNVTEVKVGDHVICSVVVTCGQCPNCHRRELPCEVGGPLAFAGTMLDGTTRLHDNGTRIHHMFSQSSFADHVVVPASSAIPVRKDAPLDKVASLGCGVSTGLGAVIHRANVTVGSSVLVLGAGGVGLAAMLGARLMGASTVIAADLFDHKLDKAKHVAADAVVNTSSTDLAVAIADLTDGVGVDAAIDCVGAEGTLEQCFQATRMGGTTVGVGLMHVTTTVTLDAFSLLMQKTITGSYAGSIWPKVDIPRFVDLYLNGRLDLDAIIDRECTLHDLEPTLADLEAGKFGRAVVKWDAPK